LFWQNFEQRSAGDPIILYDTEYHKWIITEFAPPSTSLLLVAISEDSDPLGVYSLYAFATPEFPDYPKYGIWKDALVVTTNEESPGILHQYLIERNTLMNGESDVTIQRVQVNGNNTEVQFLVTTPVNWSSGPAPKDSNPIVVKLNDSSWGEVSEDQVEVISFDIDFANSDNTTVTELAIPTTPFDGNPCSVTGDGFDCVPQLGTRGLDAVPEVIMNVPQYRNFGTHESFVLSFITDVTDGDSLAGIRWMEMRKNDNEDWTLYQEGTYSPDGLDRYMPSIALDASGNIAMAYNASSEEEFVSVRFTGRRESDPLGQMTFDEAIAVNGRNQIASGGRFGDYSHISLDPTDGQTFWYTTEYGGNGNNNSKTRILSCKIDETRDNDLAAVAITNSTHSASHTESESVTVSILNKGTIAATDFQVQLLLGSDVIDTYTHTTPLEANDELEHTFSETVDLRNIGNYQLTVNVIYEDDFADNNTFTTTVRQLIQLDGSIALRTNRSILCEGEVSSSVFVRLLNHGFDTLKSANLDFLLNGTLQKTILWTGAIARCRSLQIQETFETLAIGENTLKVVLKDPNNDTDDNTVDNEYEITVNNDVELDKLAVNITPDNFPGETSWIITDGQPDGNIFTSSNSYEDATPGELIPDFACLPKNQCFKFIISDDFEGFFFVRMVMDLMN